MRIFKYPLEIMDKQTVLMHPGEILHVETQRDRICVWALVDPELPEAPRKFAMIGTGCECKYGSEQYIGTVRLSDGRLGFHVFCARKVKGVDLMR
jgi:hypothetical protein